MSGRRISLAGVIVFVALAGCGVPTDDEPQQIDRRDVPFDLLERAPKSTAPTPQPG